MQYPSRNAGYWSRSAYSPDNALLLYFNQTAIYPSNYYNRYPGDSLRCLYHHVK